MYLVEQSAQGGGGSHENVVAVMKMWWRYYCKKFPERLVREGWVVASSRIHAECIIDNWSKKIPACIYWLEKEEDHFYIQVRDPSIEFETTQQVIPTEIIERVRT
jgi:hypothetical protein